MAEISNKEKALLLGARSGKSGFVWRGLLAYCDLYQGEEYTDEMGQKWEFNGLWYEPV